MAPAISAVKLLSPLRAGRGNATRVSPPARNAATRTRATRTNRGQRPTRRGRSARRGRVGRWPGALAPGWPRISVALWQGRWPLPWGAGRALAGGFGPRLVKDRRGAVAGAMAPAMEAVKLLSSVRAGTENATRVSRVPVIARIRTRASAPQRAGARPGGAGAGGGQGRLPQRVMRAEDDPAMRSGRQQGRASFGTPPRGAVCFLADLAGAGGFPGVRRGDGTLPALSRPLAIGPGARVVVPGVRLLRGLHSPAVLPEGLRGGRRSEVNHL